MRPHEAEQTGRGRRALVVLAGVLACAAACAGAGPPVPQPAPAQVPQDSMPDPNEPDSASSQVATAALVPADPVAVEKGRHMYKDYCQKCHGVNMVSPGAGFFDLRTFPPAEKARFVNSVTHGKRAMPAWGGVLQPDDLDLLWAYISSGGAAR